MTGAWAFKRASQVATRVAQLRDPLPPFQSRYEVPWGLLAWLRRLLSKDPTGRSRSAAHAVEGLVRAGLADPTDRVVARIC